jgi:hypothetical protein
MIRCRVRDAARALSLFDVPSPDHQKDLPPAPHRRQILGQNQEPERNHPETEHRQESKKTAENQARAQHNSRRRAARQMETLWSRSGVSPRAGVET